MQFEDSPVEKNPMKEIDTNVVLTMLSGGTFKDYYAEILHGAVILRNRCTQDDQIYSRISPIIHFMSKFSEFHRSFVSCNRHASTKLILKNTTSKEYKKFFNYISDIDAYLEDIDKYLTKKQEEFLNR